MSTGWVTTADPPWIYKDPQAVKAYGFDWRLHLAEGETIVTAEWTVPAGLTKDSAALSEDARTAYVVLSGGSLATGRAGYLVVCKVTTSLGRVDRQSGRVIIKQG